MIALKYILLIVLYIALINSKDPEYRKYKNDKIMAILIYVRHGARAPAIEDFKSHDWAGHKKGDLTKKGIKQLEMSGKHIRKQYIVGNSYMPQLYNGK
jgi:hypothetical protein